MDEDKNLNEIDEAVAEVDVSSMNDEELKKAISDKLSSFRTQYIALGFRVACKTVLDYIEPWHKPNCSHREYERIFKKLEEFCGKALKQPENKTEDETVQN